MPAWLHRTDKTLLRSVPERKLPEPVASYIEEPDLSAVAGQPTKYWIITGDVVSLADQATRDAIDAAEVAATQAALRTNVTTEVDARSDVGLNVRALIELLNKRDNYLVNRVSQLQDALIALQASAGNAGTRLDSLPTSYLATATRTKADAVQDYKDDITAGNQDV